MVLDNVNGSMIIW